MGEMSAMADTDDEHDGKTYRDADVMFDGLAELELEGVSDSKRRRRREGGIERQRGWPPPLSFPTALQFRPISRSIP